MVDDLLLCQAVGLHRLELLGKALTMTLVARQRLDHLLLELYLVVLDLNHAERLLLEHGVVVREYFQKVQRLV